MPINWIFCITDSSGLIPILTRCTAVISSRSCSVCFREWVSSGVKILTHQHLFDITRPEHKIAEPFARFPLAGIAVNNGS